MVATDDITRRKRAAQTGQPVLVRLQPDQLADLDAWIARQSDDTSRPEAVRKLLAVALGTESRPR